MGTRLFRLYSDQVIMLPATDGTGTFATSTSYTWKIDHNFVNWKLNVPGRPAPEMPVNMYEMDEYGDGGTYAQIFGATGIDPEGLHIPQAKAESFGRYHRSKLHPKGFATFMLFTRGDEPVKKDHSNLFVVVVRVHSGRLSTCPYEFIDDRELDPVFRYRVVIREPQFIIPQTR